ncbi:MAG: hypothetical protein Q9172_006645 [Xanthocarpia lactea]
METHNVYYPGFSQEPFPDHTPGNTAFKYSGRMYPSYNFHGQPSDSTEITILRSNLALAESRIVEMQKDIAEAKTVIDYLLKLNAGADSHNYRLRPSGLPQDTSSAVQDAKGILTPIIGLLQDVVGAGLFSREQLIHSASRSSLKSGNLIDLLNEEPRPEVQVAKDSWGQPDLMSFESNTLLPASLVTRFRNVRDWSGDAKGNFAEHSPKPPVSPQTQYLFDLQKSFNESESDLSGSTIYATFEPASTDSTSPSSSFYHSDDGIDQAIDNRDGKRITNPRTHPSTSALPDTFEVDEHLDQDGFSDVAGRSNSSDIEPQASGHATLYMPKWPVSSFAVSAIEREGTVFIHQRNASDQEIRFPDIFKYGIRFRPDPIETNIYRTIVITQLPPTLIMSSLLEKIRGGTVMDAKLLDTTSIDSHSTALITFVHESEAKALESKAREEPLKFLGSPARVVLLPTPTWPTPGGLRAAVNDLQRTRCLEVHNLPRGIKPAELDYDLRICRCMSTTRIEAKRLRPDGVLEIRFNSIKYAGQAYGILTKYRRYKYCKVIYAPDPCAQPWNDSSDEAHAAIEPVSPQAKKPDNVNPDTAPIAGVSRWKEYAHETFTGVPSLIQAHIDNTNDSEDRTGRLSEADVDEAATNQRGRGFTRKESFSRAIDDDCILQ